MSDEDQCFVCERTVPRGAGFLVDWMDGARAREVVRVCGKCNRKLPVGMAVRRMLGDVLLRVRRWNYRNREG